MLLYYSVKLNGRTITDNVSIGVVTREKLAEPLDDGSLHLPISLVDIEYPIKGLLEIEIEQGEEIIKQNFLIIDDSVSEGSKYGEYKHDLTVMEYSAKYDDYVISTFSSTKRLKDDRLAPFTFHEDFQKYAEPSPINDTTEELLGFTQHFYMTPLNVVRTYYTDEVIKFNQVPKAYLTTMSVTVYDYEYIRQDVIIRTNAPISPNKFILSDEDATFQLPKGEWVIEYGLTDTFHYETTKDVYLYSFKVRVVDREEASIYDLIEQLNSMKSKFGGVESKQFYEMTRLFQVDDNIKNYLKSIEAPQIYLQKMTLRQALNTVFSYVNAISRFKKGEDGEIDTLTMDEFNKITGIFEMEGGVSGYSSQRSGSELTLKGVSFLERTMPNNLEEPTIETPADNYFKTVRAVDIQMTEDSFELKLERPLYKPKKLEFKLPKSRIRIRHQQEFIWRDLPIKAVDITNRWVNIDEYRLKEITTNFPSIHLVNAFTKNVGMLRNMTELIYWKEGDTSIKMSDVFGKSFKDVLIRGVIYAAINEWMTRNPIYPHFATINDTPTMTVINHLEVGIKTWKNYLYNDLAFNVEYISLEDIVVDVDKKDIDDNFRYYSEAKLDQTDKLVSSSLATRGMSGDIQRAGMRELAVTMYHNNLLDILKMGMFNPQERLTITEVKLNLQNEFIAATYTLSRDFNRSQMFRSILQEYRWSEIPTSNKVHERHEIYKDYLIVVEPDDISIWNEITKIRDDTTQQIFEVLGDRNYPKHTKITFAYVRTDGMEDYYDQIGGILGGALVGINPSAKPTERSMVMTPVSSFGIKDGLSFSFGFENNIVAGDALDFVGGSMYNKAVRYTDEEGKFTKFWFSLHQTYEGSSSAITKNNHPLYKIEVNKSTYDNGLIDTGHPDFERQDSDYLIWHKDSRQNAKLSYQISILPKDSNLYVFGQSFFSNNYLVKNRDEPKKKYLYLYDNVEDYEFLKYGLFDDLKIKDGYSDVVPLISQINLATYYEDNKLKVRFLGDVYNLFDGKTHWAIGDEEGNLYLACNDVINGFDVVERHIRNNVDEMGYYEFTEDDLWANTPHYDVDIEIDQHYELPQINDFIVPTLYFDIDIDQHYELDYDGAIKPQYYINIEIVQHYEQLSSSGVQTVYNFNVDVKQSIEESITTITQPNYVFNINITQNVDDTFTETTKPDYTFNIDIKQNYEYNLDSAVSENYIFDTYIAQHFNTIISSLTKPDYEFNIDINQHLNDILSSALGTTAKPTVTNVYYEQVYLNEWNIYIEVKNNENGVVNMFGYESGLATNGSGQYQALGSFNANETKTVVLSYTNTYPQGKYATIKAKAKSNTKYMSDEDNKYLQIEEY